MQGNDYLPKLRGLSITNFFNYYRWVVNQFPNKKDRILFDAKEKNFHYCFLYRFLQCISDNNSAIGLNVVIPSFDNDLKQLLVSLGITDEIIWNENGIEMTIQMLGECWRS
jgi:hypothetical protein